MSALPMNEQEEISPEIATYRLYKELGTIKSNAEAQRKEVRKEVEAFMADGLFLGEGGRGLRLAYKCEGDFDWKRARGEGKIPDDVFKEYSFVKVTPDLRDVNMSEDEAEAQRRLNLIRNASEEMYSRLEEVLKEAPELPDWLRSHVKYALNKADGVNQ